MLILASASPRRQALLEQIGLTFTVQAAEIDETPQVGEDPQRYVQRLAEHKASAVLAAHRDPGRLIVPRLIVPRLIVLGADTTVVAGGRSILGKPVDAADAARMLRLLAGSTHEVMTGVALVTARTAPSIAVEVTEVDMAELTDQQIADYIATGEPIGKAGAYAIQGRAARFIPAIRGCYSNVVGLPLARVSRMLADLQQQL